MSEIQPAQEQDKKVALQIDYLLSVAPSKSASFEQWSYYYKQLVQQAGCCRGEQIQYGVIKEKERPRGGKKINGCSE